MMSAAKPGIHTQSFNVIFRLPNVVITDTTTSPRPIGLCPCPPTSATVVVVGTSFLKKRLSRKTVIVEPLSIKILVEPFGVSPRNDLTAAVTSVLSVCPTSNERSEDSCCKDDNAKE